MQRDPSSVPPAASDPAGGGLFDASLLEICHAMGAGLALREVLDTILLISLRHTRAQQGSILLFDRHGDRLKMLASLGLPHEIVAKGYIVRRGSIAEWVIDHDEPLILTGEPEGRGFVTLGDERPIVSALCVPLRAEGRVLGTINLNRTDPEAGRFEAEDLRGMTILAGQAAIYIEYARLHELSLQQERLAAIGQTVAGVSHCIKNLLTGMKGGIALCRLSRQNQDWEVEEQAVSVMENSVTRISSLVLDMLDYCKDRVPQWQEVDLDALLREIRGVTRKKAGELSLELEVEIDEEARKAPADEHQLFRCLLNLIENSLEAAGEGGRVWVRARRSTAPGALARLRRPDTAAIVIEVSDTGPGIEPAHHPHVFEAFYSTKGAKGTGLGLAVARKIAEEHGGALELASEPYQPAVFALYLPATGPEGVGSSPVEPAEE